MKNDSLLGPWIRLFLLEHLVAERNLSPNTQRSCRDTFCLLLPRLALQSRTTVDVLEVEDYPPMLPYAHPRRAPHKSLRHIMGLCCRQHKLTSRSMTNSSHGRSGVSRMRLPRHSRNWIRFHSSRRPPNSVNSPKPGFHSRSSPWGGVGKPPLLVDELAGVAWRFDVSVDWNGDIRFRLTSVSARDLNLRGKHACLRHPDHKACRRRSVRC
jgi:hypothetical protein